MILPSFGVSARGMRLAVGSLVATWVDRATFALAVTVAGCTVEPLSGVEESSMGHGQFSETMGIWVPIPVTWVLVVDDAPTDEARVLRQQLARDVIGVFDDIDSAEADIDPDPGVFRPIDYRIVVVGASDTLPPVHVEHDPDLAVQADNATPEVQNRWEEAVGRAILATETPNTEPLLAIEVASRWRRFLIGEEEPSSAADRLFAGSIPNWNLVTLLVATTRPDEGTSSVERLDAGHDVASYGAYLPSWGTCYDGEPVELALPRLAQAIRHWVPSSCTDEVNLFSAHGVADGSYSCLPSQPRLDAKGQAACLLHGYVPLEELCPKELGWLDPMDNHGVRRPRVGVPHFANEFWRVCELPQLEGPALRSCREDFTCDDCEPGWCFRRAWTEEDLSQEIKVRDYTFSADFETWCERNFRRPSYDRVRIVHEAGIRSMSLKLTCNSDPDVTEVRVPGIPEGSGAGAESR